MARRGGCGSVVAGLHACMDAGEGTGRAAVIHRVRVCRTACWESAIEGGGCTRQGSRRWCASPLPQTGGPLARLAAPRERPTRVDPGAAERDLATVRAAAPHHHQSPSGARLSAWFAGASSPRPSPALLGARLAARSLQRWAATPLSGTAVARLASASARQWYARGTIGRLLSCQPQSGELPRIIRSLWRSCKEI